MKTSLRLIIFFAFINVSTNAQIMFQKTFGGSLIDFGASVHQTTDGGFILTGRISLSSTDQDAFLIKTNANGDTLWTKKYGGLNLENGSSVEPTTDGGYIVTGWTSSFGAGNFDVYLIKTDAVGDTLWTKTYGGTQQDQGRSVQQTTDGGYIVSGTTRSFGLPGFNAYLIKTNANGDTLWTKAFGGPTGQYDGHAVKQTADGGYIVGGWANGITDLCLIKTNSTGDSLWTKTYGGINADLGADVQQTTDGGYILAGKISGTGVGNNDACLIKTNAVGDTLWTKTYGGLGDNSASTVQQTTDGGYIFVGLTNSFGAGNYDIYLIKTNAAGDTLWTTTYGGTNDEQGSAVYQTVDGGYIIIGYTNSLGAGNSDIYLIKTDVNGNSGCNQNGTATIVKTPAIIVNGTAASISSTNTVIKSPATLVRNGVLVTPLCFSVRINESSNTTSFLMFPNPSSGNFNIELGRRVLRGTVEIINILGENIFSKNILNEDRMDINLNTISSGIYFVKVFDGHDNFCNKIFFKNE